MFIFLKLQWVHSQNYQGENSMRAQIPASTQLNDKLPSPYKQIRWGADNDKRVAVNSMTMQNLIGPSVNPHLNSQNHELERYRTVPSLVEQCMKRMKMFTLEKL